MGIKYDVLLDRLRESDSTTLGSATLGDLGDVILTGVNEDDVIMFTGSYWRNVEPSIFVGSIADSIDHDTLLNWVYEKHIDWTNATEDLTTTGDIYCYDIHVGSSSIFLGTGAGELKISVDATGSDLSLGSGTNVICHAPFFEGDGSQLYNIDIGSELDFNDLVDVDITSPTIGDLLVYNGSQWVNQFVEPTARFLTNCSAAELVGEPVYMFGSDDVRKADATVLSTAKVAGFVESKPTATTAWIKMAGPFTNILTGLDIGSDYFLSETPGIIVTTVPTDPGTVIVALGKALTANSLLINITDKYIVRA